MPDDGRATVCRYSGLTSLGAALSLCVVCALVGLNNHNADKADGWGSYDQLTEENKSED